VALARLHGHNFHRLSQCDLSPIGRVITLESEDPVMIFYVSYRYVSDLCQNDIRVRSNGQLYETIHQKGLHLKCQQISRTTFRGSLKA